MAGLLERVKILVRALRLPFVSASIFPFVLGSLLAGNDFHFLRFFLGLIAAVATHLSANLINDYFDSRSGADWLDSDFYGFFGGSKLIQEKILTERFFLNASIFFAVSACLAAASLARIMGNISVIGFFLLIIVLSWLYSAQPFQLSYHRIGELVIFILFGPALVMGGHFIQTGLFPTLQGFLVSLPMGFLVTAILFVNEIPDYRQDRDAKKYTWVSLTGPKRAWVLYLILTVAAFFFVVMNVMRGFFSAFALISLIFLVPVVKAAAIARLQYKDKKGLLASSKLTIATHAMVSGILITDFLIRCKK